MHITENVGLFREKKKIFTHVIKAFPDMQWVPNSMTAVLDGHMKAEAAPSPWSPEKLPGPGRCCGLNVKCPTQVLLFEHLVSS